MTHILHVTCSPRGSGSYSTALSTAITERLGAAHLNATLNRRDLHAAPLAPLDAAFADDVVSRSPPNGRRSGALDGSAACIAELQAAEVVVIGTPMHNFTIPAALKLWIDLVVRAFHTFTPGPDGKAGLLIDRPVFVAVASGGTFAGAGANQPDFLTPYLTAALGCIGLHDLRFLLLQGTARRSTDALSCAIQDMMGKVSV
ncbi:FMN-dependent NADH-azoreductase [Sphingomonas morindae]|uniref:FMN dependent NADH:quinone oxidoreductase n=1 Tax=Sphingomonas morindae TaxID=1541170 RepID=A0ABY4X3W8_9SPHN|nr:NAD(P)H-dependent oxidoreductase [Sphingomonas morindae]USI71586.1 NAD(P)H-dependent oxidoreductase [Sphingomonas morindae]